jgi:hypothetical protein
MRPLYELGYVANVFIPNARVADVNIPEDGTAEDVPFETPFK